METKEEGKAGNLINTEPGPGVEKKSVKQRRKLKEFLKTSVKSNQKAAPPDISAKNTKVERKFKRPPKIKITSNIIRIDKRTDYLAAGSPRILDKNKKKKSGSFNVYDIDNFVVQSNANKIKERPNNTTSITTPVFKDLEINYYYTKKFEEPKDIKEFEPFDALQATKDTVLEGQDGQETLEQHGEVFDCSQIMDLEKDTKTIRKQSSVKEEIREELNDSSSVILLNK